MKGAGAAGLREILFYKTKSPELLQDFLIFLLFKKS